MPVVSRPLLSSPVLTCVSQTGAPASSVTEPCVGVGLKPGCWTVFAATVNLWT